MRISTDGDDFSGDGDGELSRPLFQQRLYRTIHSRSRCPKQPSSGDGSRPLGAGLDASRLCRGVRHVGRRNARVLGLGVVCRIDEPHGRVTAWS